MADQLQTDPRIYGGVTPSESTATQSASIPVPEYKAPTPVAVETVETGNEAEAAAARAEANRDKATITEVAGAAASQWATTRVWDYFTSPSFEPEKGYNAGKDIGRVPRQLSLDEEAFLAKAQSPAEFRFRADELEQQYEARKTMGDNPVAAALVSFADPVYLAIDVASLGAGRVVSAGRTGRVIAGITAASGAAGVGVIESEVAPVTTKEIIANALINGAATGLFFNAASKRLEPRDADFPSAELRKLGQQAHEAIAPTPAPEVKWVQRFNDDGTPVMHPVTGKPIWRASEDVPTALGRNAAEAAQAQRIVREGLDSAAAPAARAEFTGASGTVYKAMPAHKVIDFIAERADQGLTSPLARSLYERGGPMLDNVKVFVMSDADLAKRGIGRAAYNATDHAVYLGHSTTPQNMLHELSHAATVHKLEYGLRNPTTEHGRIASEFTAMRESAAAYARQNGVNDELVKYYTANNREFVAGLYSGDSPFLRMLAKMPDESGRSMLAKAVDIVRRALGLKPSEANALTRAMQLADDLMQTKDVNFLSGIESGAAVRTAPQVGQRVDSLASKTGDTIAWNLHKTLAGYNKRAADLLVDNPLDMSGDSVVSQQRAIRSELATRQYAYEDLLSAELAKAGFGGLNRIVRPRAAVQAQQRIEREVALEMLRREQAQRTGGPARLSTTPEHVNRMADALDEVSAAALDEMKRAGVNGAEQINQRAGYFSRKWDSAKIDEFVNRTAAFGWSEGQAIGRLTDTIAAAIRRANPWDAEVAQDVASAIVQRTRRKGEFTDSAFRAHVGNEQLAEVRDILTGSGIRGERLQRAMDVLAGQIDEAGKPAALKHRIDMDMRGAVTLPDGSSFGITDLIDMNLTNLTDRYLDVVSGQAALARKGLYGPSDIGRLRAEMVQGIERMSDREAATKLFDNVVNHLMGRPAGDDIPQAMRKMQAVTQMVGLASSGLWQVTEYATAMQKYGFAKSMKYALAHMPGFRSMFDDVARNKDSAQHLSNVLSRQSYQDIRMRPFLNRLEDNFDFPVSDQVMMSLQQGKQVVPYLNAMKFVHHHQAQMVGNLVTDVIERGARGDAKARNLLRQYGLESDTMDRVAADIKQHGLDTSLWSDATWDAVRGPVGKMMDESVLRNRTGEIPAFAQFSQVGKFIFTFRSFVLGAHNKVLAGTLNRSGFSGVGLMALYQFPLAQLATLTDNTIKGKEPLEGDELALRAVSQMGVLGLGSEIWGAVTGQKQQFGAPGLIAVDRVFGAVNHASSGNFGGAANDVINSVPLLPLIPGIKAIGETLK